MSDSMNRRSGLVIGTAGHIDHGKTSLIRALTGIDTDRLAEEKRRGISIDLGFAHLALPGGSTISFIDVPGHERFIRNMLAGVGGIQAIMLIVAADESVMPQTREHFEICRLLGIRHGFVVLTKTDLASSEQIALSRDDIAELCAGSFLEKAPVLEVSSIAHTGIPAVLDQLAFLAKTIPPRAAAGLARLPIDRSFTLTGFGTVVTGTLLSGEFRAGDTVLLHPLGKQARIRGVQVHGQSVASAGAGERTAINLSGIESAEVKRGFVLTHANEMESAGVLDVSIEWLPGEKPPARRQQVLLHVGTAEIVADLKMLSPGYGRLWLADPALALPDDRFILRRPSPAITIAGGSVIDAFPSLHLSRVKTAARIPRLAPADMAGRLSILIQESPSGRRINDLVRLTGYDATQLVQLVESQAELFFHPATQRAFTKDWLGTRRAELIAWLQSFHEKNPSATGAPISTARLGLEPEVAAVVTERFPAVRLQGEFISLATHKAIFSDQESRALAVIEDAFRKAGYQPPAANEVLRSASSDPKKGRALLDSLLKNKRLVKISDDLIFHSDVLSHVRNALAAHKGRKFSIPEFKEWTQMSRKYAIPVLEYLDREKVTRRDGDFRIVN